MSKASKKADGSKRGVPLWTYSADYYTRALEGTGLEIFTDAVKGKGLRTTRAIAADDLVHEETALCCSQNMDDHNDGVPVCAFCLLALETPRAQVARNTQSKKVALELPYNTLHMPASPVRCLWAETGCAELFCSVRCRESAMERFHAVSCRGRMTSAQRTASDAFFAYDWVQDGVDYSDTAILALRIVAQALCAHRLQPGCTVQDGFAPYAQLIQSPITSFYFSYLLADTVPTAASTADELAAHAAAFKASRVDPMALPEVKAVYDAGGRSKVAMCMQVTELLHRLFNMDSEERGFYTAARWSSVMGAVLLNGQDRSPLSPYDLHRELVCCLPDGPAAMEEFERAVMRNAAVTDVAQLSPGSRGQGIYGVGCLFNHSCEPNLNVQYSTANDETLSVVALRDIAVHEELTISYIDTAMPYTVRQQQLLEHYLFECQCARCRREASALAAAVA